MAKVKYSIEQRVGVVVVYKGDKWPYSGVDIYAPEVVAYWNGEQVDDASDIGWHWEMSDSDIEAAKALCAKLNAGAPDEPPTYDELTAEVERLTAQRDALAKACRPVLALLQRAWVDGWPATIDGSMAAELEEALAAAKDGGE